MDLAGQNSGGESACRDQASMAERDLTRIAGEQHQRQRSDRGEKYLTGEIKQERRCNKWQCHQHHGKGKETDAFGAGL